MAGIEQFFTRYQKYHSTFKETSYDDKKGMYLCTDTSQNVINFDSMVQEKYIKQEKTPKSFDAIYFLNHTLYLIEFKNQIPSKIDNKDVQEKLIAGKKS
ncbi:MAG: hypothetical protein Q9M40_12800 [Sulfurimonas sp.]|nr:hypothetical protein [Sulfurimonas sp.]